MNTWVQSQHDGGNVCGNWLWKHVWTRPKFWKNAGVEDDFAGGNDSSGRFLTSPHNYTVSTFHRSPPATPHPPHPPPPHPQPHPHRRHHYFHRRRPRRSPPPPPPHHHQVQYIVLVFFSIALVMCVCIIYVQIYIYIYIYTCIHSLYILCQIFQVANSRSICCPVPLPCWPPWPKLPAPARTHRSTWQIRSAERWQRWQRAPSCRMLWCHSCLGT